MSKKKKSNVKAKKTIKKASSSKTTKIVESKEKFEDITFSDQLFELKKSSPTVSGEVYVLLSQLAYSQIVGYLTSTKCEVSCFGTLDILDNALFVQELFLPEQTGAGAETNINPANLSKLVTEMVKNGQLEKVEKLKVWFHSHPNMEASFSSIDINEAIPAVLKDYMLSIVVNEDFEMSARFDMAKPLKVAISNLPVYLEGVVFKDVASKCRQELSKKVKVKKLVSKSLWNEDYIGDYACYWPSKRKTWKDSIKSVTNDSLIGLGGEIRSRICYPTTGEELITYTDQSGLVITESGRCIYLTEEWLKEFKKWKGVKKNKEKLYSDFVNEMLDKIEKDSTKFDADVLENPPIPL